jgi:multidrug efflux pump subunit AcrA (membrane-fusion protein)
VELVAEKRAAEVAPKDALKVAKKTASTVLLMRSNIVKDVETISVWPQGAEAPSSLVELARQATNEGRSLQKTRFSKTSQTSTTLIAVPLSNKSRSSEPGKLIGAIAMAMPTKTLGAEISSARQSGKDSDNALTQSSPRAQELQNAMLASVQAKAEQAEERRSAASVLELLGIIHRHSKFESSATEFVSELNQRLGTQRVSIGFIRDGHSKLTAISNVATLKNSAVLSRDLALAMDEAIDQTSTVVFPQPKGSEPKVTLAHERFSTRHESANLVTVPILIDEDGRRSLVGALVAEYKLATEINPQSIELIEQLSSILGPVLDNKRRASATISNLFHSGFRGQGKQLLTPSKRATILWAVSALILMGLSLFPIQHRVTATARLEGSTQRVMSAAVDGYIAAVHARPGVRIKKGQALVDLDDRDLQLERRKLEAEYSQTERKYGDALVKEDQSQIAIQQAKLGQIKAQVGTIDDQLGRIKVTAPFDGVVLNGDQSQSLGAPVKRGDVLMTVAPSNQYRLVIEVDERDIALLNLKQTGQLVLSALPDKTLNIEIARITPVALVKDGLNVFEVEAQLTGSDALVQPGLEGVAKIETGSKPMISVLTNRLRQWVSVSLWKWKL